MKRKTAAFVVDHRRAILAVMLLLAAVCAFLLLKVEINTDLTKYLPAGSDMKQGIDIMAEEFPPMEMSSTLRVMFDHLPPEEEESVRARLAAIPNVTDVAWKADSPDYHRGDHTLFVLSSAADYKSAEFKAIGQALDRDFREYTLAWHDDDTGIPEVPAWILLSGVAAILLILLLMCRSWIEPLLFLAVIGVAVLINQGTNIIQGSVSIVTASMASILQLVLSMDYSIILSNRFRQEKEKGASPEEAMKTAVEKAFPSVASSGMTTVAGLLMLLFMSFRIGMDLGIVLAKGVFLSMFCVLVLLPGILLSCDALVQKTAKKSPRIPMRRLAAFSDKMHLAVTVFFVLLMGAAFILQQQTGIVYTLQREDPVAEIFPADNTLVLVYENQDESAVPELCAMLETDPKVKSVSSYYTSLARPYTAAEMAASVSAMMGDMQGGISFDENTVSVLYALRFAGEEPGTMTLEGLFDYVYGLVQNNSPFAMFLGEEAKVMLADAKQQLDDGKKQLAGPRYSRMIVVSEYPDEAPETFEFIEQLSSACKEKFSGRTYLIGNSAMNYEMSGSFGGEYLFITLLTAAVIYLIVALTTKSFIIPLILVLIVQTGVYITVSGIGLFGDSIYFLALLIVQCILMGATIDYGILFTNYYTEYRRTAPVSDSIRQAYEGAIHTIATSGLILVLVTSIVGRFFNDPTITAIVNTLSLGSLIAILLILIFLPGILITADKLIRPKK